MICEKCGGELRQEENKLVCTKCGAEFSAESDVQTPSAEYVVPRGFSSKKLIIIIIVAALLIIGGVSAIVAVNVTKSNSQTALTDIQIAERYLSEQNYEQAIIEFEKILEIEPMNVEAYIGLAEAYIGKGDTEKALEILRNGLEQTGDARLQAKIDELTKPEEPAISSSSSSTSSEVQSSSTTETSSTSVQAVIEPVQSSSSTTFSESTLGKRESQSSSTGSISSFQTESMLKDDITQWNETKVYGLYYVNRAKIYSRAKPSEKSAAVKQYNFNEKIYIVGFTDTGYFVLKDGSYLHGDCLSNNKLYQPVSSEPPGNLHGVPTQCTATARSLPEEVTLICEEKIVSSMRNEMMPLYYVDTETGKYWTEGDGFYYSSLENVLNGENRKSEREVLPTKWKDYDPNWGAGLDVH